MQAGVRRILVGVLHFYIAVGVARAGDAGGAVGAAEGVRLLAIGPGYARNSVNVAIFRKSSLVTHGDTQFAAFYDGEGRVVLAKRKLNEAAWETKTTSLTGTTKDAHNAINIGVDGDGFLHVAWDHHDSPLNYRRGKAPLSLELVEAPVTGENEKRITYPEFHPLAGGDLLLLYRDGASGRGNLVVNRYDVKTHAWRQLHAKLIDGQGRRNAYWQACTGVDGAIHLSWVWRDSPDVATNHDLCYARSADGGATWTKSTGARYALPITADSAEYAARIPQRQELINQTSMTADGKGQPYIATYFRAEGADVPQYHVIHHDGAGWQTRRLDLLTQPFPLGGGGTKRIPISRPQILVRDHGRTLTAHVVFRAEERGSRASLASCDDLAKGKWTVRDLTTTSLGQWEPTYDIPFWVRDGVLHLFVQRAEQVDAEGVAELPPQMVHVAEVTP
jgi:hypothetical protein